MVLESWDRVRPSFVDGTAERNLRALLDQIQAGLPEADRVSSDGISIKPVQLGSERGFLIVMPRPETAPEAALAVIPDRPAPTRYFVLERGEHASGDGPYWVLCEWDQGRHLNLGPCGESGADGPELETATTARIASIL